MKQIDFCVWFDSQAEAEANIGLSPFRNAKLRRLPRGGEADQEQGQQRTARDAQADRLHNVAAT
jgi:predicted 3-demethylubiquinone-9 3-methyltransferase (glyoxalase superfamily)